MATIPFDAITYLYLNPELPAYSNVKTIEGASNFYYTNPNGPALMYDTSIIPVNLDPFVYLSTNKENIPISLYSQTIYNAMSNDGIPSQEILSTSKFVSSIVKESIYTATNTFTLTSSSYLLNSSNVNIGDTIRVFDNVKTEYILTLSSFNNTTKTIIVDNNKYTFYVSSNYTIDGIKAIDPLRIASIAVARFGTNTIVNTSNILPESGAFNATLYKILYPNAARLTDQEAYIDYVSKRKNNVLRVNNAEELLVNYVATSNIKVTGVNNTINRQLPAGESNRLVTEFAVRTFTEDLFSEVSSLANFSQVFVTSNFTSTGQATFEDDVTMRSNFKVLNQSILCGPVTMCNTLQVMQNAYFNSNVVIDANELVYGTLSVNGNSYQPRIGIGYYMDADGTNNASNVPATQADTNELSNISYPTSNVAYSASNVAYPLSNMTYPLSNMAYTLSNTTFNLSNTTSTLSNITYLMSNMTYPMSNMTYPMSNYTYTNIPILSNVAFRTSNYSYTNMSLLSNIAFPLSNYTYPRTFSISGNSLYVQSNVSIGFGSSLNSLTVSGQMYSGYDSNWVTGGIRFRSTSGSNDAGVAQGSNGFLRFLSPSNDGAGGFQWINNARNAILMQLDNSNGNLNVYGNLVSYNTNISDKRFKDNITPFTGYETYIQQLNPVSFIWNSNVLNKEKVGQLEIGLVAQDVAMVFPQAHTLTSFGGNEINVVNYEKLVPILLAACKGFQERICKLEHALSNNMQNI
jgi:hypothetical protein